jgi:hypothetical protein
MGCSGSLMTAASNSVESRCGAVAVGRTYLLPPLSFGGASLVQPWLRLHTALVKPDMQISRIRLSPVPSDLRSRPVDTSPRNAVEAECAAPRNPRRPSAVNVRCHRITDVQLTFRRPATSAGLMPRHNNLPPSMRRASIRRPHLGCGRSCHRAKNRRIADTPHRRRRIPRTQCATRSMPQCVHLGPKVRHRCDPT